ncbi:hypothetical protein NQ315_010941 [Exocentrus adspersus]|uniref:C2H2-type domain-containing protein n=1 Tax=Exocentrus adspersus TaxID=1586481 RepID=A0AAV8VPB6_9CUCU|nr:hypothetical protein NQ315_010941 [Exocentrus adspersus]
MHNLSVNVQKRTLFTSLFNIKQNNFRKYPNFLCNACDDKLNLTSNFRQCVMRSLAILEEYNKQINSTPLECSEGIKDELQNGDTDCFVDTDIHIETEQAGKTDASDIKIVDSEQVDKAIEGFKNRFSQNKTCVICGFVAANRRSISSHMAIFHKDTKNRWCLECNDIFENYEHHKASHGSRQRCPFCEKKVTLPHYIEHLQSHSGTFECKECGKAFKSGSWLTKHLRIHTNEKPYTCPNCCKGFIQLSSLRYHLGTHGKYSCEVCKKRFKTEDDIPGHECDSKAEVWVNSGDGNESEVETIIIKGVGSLDLQNFCKDCNKRVKSLGQHMKRHHRVANEEPSPKTATCEFCQKTFSNSNKLRIHARIHTGELPYKCKYCDKRALSRSRLVDHERTHTKEKPYICSVCGKALSQSSALRTHMKQHTGRTEICNLCGKSFCRKSELRLHLRYKPFQCPSCPYACYKAYRLQQHMKQHNNESYDDGQFPEPVVDKPNSE